MCGDSTSQEDVNVLMGPAIADCCITDPPYNVDYGSKAESINKYGYEFSDRHLYNDCMPDDQFLEFLQKAFANMKEHLKEGGSFYIWHASTTIYEFEKALRLNGLQTRQQLIWVKNTMVLGRQDYQWRHEPCLYGWKEGAGHYFINDRTQTTVRDDNRPLSDLKKDELIAILEKIYAEEQSILYEDKPRISEEHPTMKPVQLIARQVINSTKPGETVLDLFGGSGTTLIASEQLGRSCYMMEYDPAFADVIIDRWEKFTGGNAERIK